jgi:hypothetical protein
MLHELQIRFGVLSILRPMRVKHRWMMDAPHVRPAQPARKAIGASETEVVGEFGPAPWLEVVGELQRVPDLPDREDVGTEEVGHGLFADLAADFT